MLPPHQLIVYSMCAAGEAHTPT